VTSKDLEKRQGPRMGRRDLLAAAGRYTMGAAAIGAVAAAVPGPRSEALASGGPSERWPWPYVKLDPQRTADLAYEEWYRVFCGAAVVNAVFGQLRDKVGEPYRSFPSDAFVFLEGGVSGWGTICGANAGANIVTNVILGPRTAGSELGMLMGSELMQHYASTAMPTYVPKAPRVQAEIPKTTAESPLCHLSVGRWMKAANKALASPERMDRCARLTASMAYQLVTLLNAWKDGKYVTRGTVPAKAYGIQAQHDCNDCHGANVPSPPSPKKI
jgi:Putative redox-active protein (C_GCAxxG_C_C)